MKKFRWFAILCMGMTMAFPGYATARDADSIDETSSSEQNESAESSNDSDSDETSERQSQTSDAENSTEPPSLWFAMNNTAPTWLNKTDHHSDNRKILASVLSTGSELSLYSLNIGNHNDNNADCSAENAQIYAIHKQKGIIGPLQPPSCILWWGTDAGDRILAFDGNALWSAQNAEQAKRADGYFKVFENIGGKFWDVAGNTVVSATDDTLRIIDLVSASMKEVALTTIFESSDPSTAAKKKQKSKKNNKTANKPAEDESSNALSQLTLLGVWWRHDGVGVVKIRKLINTFVFITKDNGQSWQKFEGESPAALYHDGAWIWDRESRALSADGTAWVSLCNGSPSIPYAKAILPTRELQTFEDVTLPAYNLPAFPAPQNPDVDGNIACTSVPATPSMDASATFDESQKIPFYQAGMGSGRQFAFWRIPELPKIYRKTTEDGEVNAVNERIMPLSIDFDTNTAENTTLPEGCYPLYLHNIAGLDILACDYNAREVAIYVRTAQTEDWVYEVDLPKPFLSSPIAEMGADGSLVLLTCSEDDEEACHVVMRRSGAPGEEHIWRFDQIHKPNGMAVLSDGRYLVFSSLDNGHDSISLYGPSKNEVLLEDYEGSQFVSYRVTSQGCIAVKKRGDLSENPAYLSVDGSETHRTCTPPPAVAEGTAMDAEEEFHDTRIGLRLSGGAFLATGVQTWTARAEVLFPISNGNYEVGAIFRMVGGEENKKDLGYTGLIAIRWRYEKLEKWQFGIGGALGYGHLCGAAPKVETKPEDGTEETGKTDPDEQTEQKEAKVSPCGSHAFKYGITGIASFSFSEKWKIFLAADLIGGNGWGGDLSAGLEVRF